MAEHFSPAPSKKERAVLKAKIQAIVEQESSAEFSSAVFVEDKTSGRGDDRTGTVILATENGEQVILKKVSRKEFYKWQASDFDQSLCPQNVRL
jgi:hypothetical protein